MSLLNQQKGNKKKGNKNAAGAQGQGSKFIAKPGKAAGASIKPHKAGGTRGS